MPDHSCIYPKFLTCKRILDFMVITCFMIHHMLRVNMAIAIVEMIDKKNSSNTPEYGPRFHWDEEQKNNILGCFFWGYLVTQIPGGRLSEIFGTRIVLGISMLLASLLTLLTPTACYHHYYWVVALRVCLGVALGVQWPSVPPMATRWVPSTDTSKFVAHTVASSLGVAITFPVCGFLIAYLKWPSVFYTTGVTTLIWLAGWFYLVYDSPGQHPRIQSDEKQKLETSIKYESNFKPKMPTPWARMLTSKPVWAIAAANFCGSFSFFVVLNQLPSYFDQVLHFDIKDNGLLSSFPYVGRYLISTLSSYIADKFRKSGKLSTSTVRKLFTTLDLLGTPLLFLVLMFWGDSRVISVIIFTGVICAKGFSTAGFHCNSVDISPTYSGTVFGFSNFFASLSGYLSAQTVAAFTREEQSFKQWRYIFGIMIGVNLVGATFYLIYGSGQVQSWNPKEDIAEVEVFKKRSGVISSSNTDD